MRLYSTTRVIAAGIKIATTDLTCSIFHAGNFLQTPVYINYLIRNLKNVCTNQSYNGQNPVTSWVG